MERAEAYDSYDSVSISSISPRIHGLTTARSSKSFLLNDVDMHNARQYLIAFEQKEIRTVCKQNTS